MSDEIKPALTPEEWRVEIEMMVDEADDDESSFDRAATSYAGTAEDAPSCHALAALCLYGQPFGFTREDVGLLRDLAAIAEAEAKRQVRLATGVNGVALDLNPAAAVARAEGAKSLFARIAALLPPADTR